MVAPTHLRSLQALDAALRYGSLAAAADRLSITPAAVGQRIKVLEDYLGVDLLTRGRSGLSPTPAVGPTVDRLRTAFRELEAVAEALNLQRGHEIHLAALTDVAELWLKPRLHRFRAQHPNILFCINGEGEAPLRLGSVDCEISFGQAADEPNRDLLFEDFIIPIGSPENVRRIAGTVERDRLEGFPLLHLDFYKDDSAAPGWADWVRVQGFHRTSPERGMRFQRIAPVLEAVRADAGLTLCGLALIGEGLDDGTLSLPFPLSTGCWTEHAFQARFRPDALARPQVRRFRHWLAEEARTTRNWLELRLEGSRNAVGITR
ncbi:LysR family transcriptional regulator [Phenylobacterium sp.]|uniref:LysR family transcriptional regulator n=1 Tax=Phenylobacterium sp. TaxID=1871053 RepID=UPI0039839F0E